MCGYVYLIVNEEWVCTKWGCDDTKETSWAARRQI